MKLSENLNQEDRLKAIFCNTLRIRSDTIAKNCSVYFLNDFSDTGIVWLTTFLHSILTKQRFFRELDGRTRTGKFAI